MKAVERLDRDVGVAEGDPRDRTGKSLRRYARLFSHSIQGSAAKENGRSRQHDIDCLGSVIVAGMSYRDNVDARQVRDGKWALREPSALVNGVRAL